MNKSFKNILAKVILFSFAFVVFGLLSLTDVKAVATAPTLGDVASFAVLGETTITNTGSSTLYGNLGLYSGTAITGFFGTVENDGPGVFTGYAVHQGNATAGLAQTAATAAYGAMASQSPGCSDLSGQNLAGKTLAPGVYCFAAGADLSLSGTLTLDAQGDPNAVWIFQVGTALTINNSASVVIINGGTGTPGCNVYWQVGSAATIGTSATFIGTIIANSAAITLNTSATMYGRAISRVAAVTLDTNTITVPTCAVVPAVPVASRGSRSGVINVVKVVINDNGGTKTVVDFPLFVNGTQVFSGVSNNFTAPSDRYDVTETTNSNYVRTFSGDCDSNGGIGLIPGDNKFCIVTNDDIGAPVVVPPVPPLIDVVKVPNPLALPNGPGLVEYTYTLTNIGTVPVTDITMVGDTCSPILLKSGDTNNDLKLDLNETWVHKCSTTLTETHTNTVVATGWANGISAVDIASAHVIVGQPIVPPLIHITKTPSTFTLVAGGGMVMYTKKVTNPGTVALSNVIVTDDKCSALKYVSGDVNNDSKLQSTETWTYTCKTNLTKTTTNTASVSGQANGLTARDFAIATVVVATVIPKLPNTGFGLVDSTMTAIIILGILAVLVSLVFIQRKQKV